MMSIDKLTEKGCAVEKKNKLCRSRGGESCVFDGAMIVLQPIADAAHIVHGPIACAGNSWEGRGTLSSKGNLHRMGFTTDMSELDVVYGSENKLYEAIIHTYRSVSPKAIFVYSTCVSGLIGEDIEAVCNKAEDAIDAMGKRIPVIPVNSPGFVGPKNLGNRIAGEVLLEHVIGRGEPGYTTATDINLIGEYNIAGDQWFIEPVLKEAGFRVLSRITGDATFDEITYAHRAKLNVVVCSRALINIAEEMERLYGIPYVEVSFFGKTETGKALRAIAEKLSSLNPAEKAQTVSPAPRDAAGPVKAHAAVTTSLQATVESVIRNEESKLADALAPYAHLKGKRAVLYTGGVKSWSIISALRDLGIDIVAVGTKKSTFEDEEKMKALLGENAPLVEDVTAKNILKLMHEGQADMLIAGGRNQYLAMKEGFPFVDVNQERHTPYTGYAGLVKFAEQIHNSIEFFNRQLAVDCRRPSAPSHQQAERVEGRVAVKRETVNGVSINPLKHSPALGAAIALQGVHNTLPIIHGAQGCGFLGKVLLTKHFREPVALASSKLFTEDVVMGSDEKLVKVIEGFIGKSNPDVVAVLSTGLSDVKGDDIDGAIRTIHPRGHRLSSILHVSTPDYDGGLETGYARAVEALIDASAHSFFTIDAAALAEQQVNVLAGCHLTPADFTELREIIESFGLTPIFLPDLAALDGSKSDFSALATGGTTLSEIGSMRLSGFTLVVGASMRPAAKSLKSNFGIEYKVLEGISGLRDVDALMEMLAGLSGRPVPAKYERQRRILTDGMRDAHFYLSGKKACLALEPDLAIQTSRWLYEMGAGVKHAVLPTPGASLSGVLAENTVIGDLFSIDGEFDFLISNSHAEDIAQRLGVPLYQMGFPVYKVLGATSRVTIGYRGTLAIINELANLLMESR